MRFDPYISILDDKRFELAACDDSALAAAGLGRQSSSPRKMANTSSSSATASYDGSDIAYYRLHVGKFPRPRTIYPAGRKGRAMT